MKQAIFDLEADNLDPKQIKNIWCLVIQDVATEDIFTYGPDKIGEGVEKLKEYDRVIGHNIAFFDLPVLELKFGFKPKSYIDTLLLSKLANPDRRMPIGMKGRWTPHALSAWGRRLGRDKIEHEDWSQFSEEMMNRCVVDVKINLAVYLALYQEFKE